MDPSAKTVLLALDNFNTANTLGKNAYNYY